MLIKGLGWGKALELANQAFAGPGPESSSKEQTLYCSHTLPNTW